MRSSGVTGFLIVRDVVRNGYPFLEAIFASLALCRTIHVLDGESSDGTWGALEALRDLVGAERLVLHREPWRERRGSHLLASATNQLRAMLPTAPGEWLWSFQANEVLDVETADELRQLLRQHREIDLFRLPFTTLMGFHYVAYTDYRGRLFRNLPDLVAIGDAYDCGFDLSTVRMRPWRLRRFLENRRRWVTGHLAHPVLRFRAPFPEQYATKLETRAQLNPWDGGAPVEAAAARAALETIRASAGSIPEFWDSVPFARESDPSTTGPIPEWRRPGPLPPVLRHLRDVWRYDPDASLAALARMGVPSPESPSTPASPVHSLSRSAAPGGTTFRPGTPAPRVTVLMPAWNRAGYIAYAISSVLAQSEESLELLVVDDGSTDGTGTVVDSIRDPRVRLLRRTHRGIGASLNDALREARGEWIARLDSDDWWDPTFLAEQLALAEREPAAVVVYARAEATDAEMKPKGHFRGAPPRLPDDPLASLLLGDFTCNITAIARRRDIVRAGGWREDLPHGEDWDLWLHVARLGPFAFNPRVLARYREHGTNVTRRRWDELPAVRASILERHLADPELPSSAREIGPTALRRHHVNAAMTCLVLGRRRGALAEISRARLVGDGDLRVVAYALAQALAWFVAPRFGWTRRLHSALLGWRDRRRSVPAGARTV